METSLLFFQQVIPLLLSGLIGFLLVRAGKMQSQEATVLAKLLAYFVLPCTIIQAFQIEATPAVWQGMTLAVLLALGVQLLFIVVTALFTRLLRLNSESVLAAAYGDVGLLLPPMIALLMGKSYLPYTAAFMGVQLLFLWFHGSAIFSGRQWWHSLGLKMNLIALLLAVFFFLWQIKLPPVWHNLTFYGSQALLPLAGLLLGLSLGKYPLRRLRKRRKNYFALVLRQLIFPILLLLLANLFPMESYFSGSKNIFTLILLTAIMPTTPLVSGITQFYKGEAVYATEITILSHLLALLTLPVFFYIFLYLG